MYILVRPMCFSYQFLGGVFFLSSFSFFAEAELWSVATAVGRRPTVGISMDLWFGSLIKSPMVTDFQ